MSEYDRVFECMDNCGETINVSDDFASEQLAAARWAEEKNGARCPDCTKKKLTPLSQVEENYSATTRFQCEAMAKALLDGLVVDDMLVSGLETERIVGGLLARIHQLHGWLDDLQSGMFINCVYCGHRYGPKEDTPVTMADILREHIEKCPEHPLAQALEEKKRLETRVQALLEELRLAYGGVPPGHYENAKSAGTTSKCKTCRRFNCECPPAQETPA